LTHSKHSNKSNRSFHFHVRIHLTCVLLSFDRSAHPQALALFSAAHSIKAFLATLSSPFISLIQAVALREVVVEVATVTATAAVAMMMVRTQAR